ncbi:nitroreductase family protein [Chloroflexota bacterium]
MECITGRRSIRNFKKKKVKDEDILLALEAATFAPSPFNCQPWKFLVIKNDQLKKQMAQVIKNKLNKALIKIGEDDDVDILENYSQFFAFFEKAPIAVGIICRTISHPIIGFLERTGVSSKELVDTSHSEIQSTAAAVQNMLLRLHEMGLGACWMTNPLIATKELESLLEVKRPWHLIGVIPIGLSASVPPLPRRKAVSSIVKFK